MTNEPQQDRNDDEIDLRDIALVLVEGWYWIIGVTIAAVILAVAYLAVTEPSYSTELRFTRAADGLGELNSMPAISYSAEQVKEELRQRLGSYANFDRFLEDNPEVRDSLTNALGDFDEEAAESAALNRFFQNITFRNPGQLEEDNGPERTLEIMYGNSLNGPDFLNQYYRWTEAQYVETLVARAERARKRAISRNDELMQGHLEAYEDEIATRITRMTEDDQIKRRELKDRLEAEKQAYRDSQVERMRKLSQAAQTAEALGISKPTTPQELGPQDRDIQVVYAELNSQNGLPLYFMGSEALRAEHASIKKNLDEDAKTSTIRNLEKQLSELEENREVQALRAREDISRFVDEYGKLQEENTLLRANTIAPADIEVAEVLNWAYRPAGPDSPRKALVLVLSVLLGGMLGVFSAFIAKFVSSLLAYRDKGA